MNTTTRPSLAARLKHETRDLHTLAEGSGVMADLMRGRIDRQAYGALLRHLHALYAALESGLDRQSWDPRLWRPELRRLPGLERDLDALHPPGWRSDAPLTPAGDAYVRRLTALASDDPALLMAHAYLRYLGDLHGGQMLARLVRQQLGLAGAEGTAFYDFGPAAQVERLKQEFRAGLDALSLTAPQADAFVAEACEGFRLHQQLFEALPSGTPA
ncbi:MAG: biliverdin-producing heme oxygenase [Rubrivivax sp.]|nr:MAG: biliverdin-producing heme oxygenase [Rubrivivax sp.]